MDFDDKRVSTHLLKLAYYIGPGTGALAGGGLGALVGGGLGYGLAPEKKKLLGTLAGALLGGSQGLWLGTGLGTANMVRHGINAGGQILGDIRGNIQNFGGTHQIPFNGSETF